MRSNSAFSMQSSETLQIGAFVMPALHVHTSCKVSQSSSSRCWLKWTVTTPWSGSFDDLLHQRMLTMVTRTWCKPVLNERIRGRLLEITTSLMSELIGGQRRYWHSGWLFRAIKLWVTVPSNFDYIIIFDPLPGRWRRDEFLWRSMEKHGKWINCSNVGYIRQDWDLPHPMLPWFYSCGHWHGSKQWTVSISPCFTLLMWPLTSQWQWQC